VALSGGNEDNLLGCVGEVRFLRLQSGKKPGKQSVVVFKEYLL